MRFVVVIAAAALLLAGCDKYQKPFKPLPETFSATALDGQKVRRADLLGKPWVISIWVPG